MFGCVWSCGYNPVMNMLARRFAAAALAAILVLLSRAPAPAQVRGPDPSFDPPLQIRVVKTGQSKSSPTQQNELRCFTYAHFMIKEIDLQEVGDEQISIIPLTPGAKPPCQTAKLPGERAFSRDGIADYFLGMKGDFVFLSAGDGVDLGLGFAVYRAADNGLVFTDSALVEDKKPMFRSVDPEPDGLRLHYTRVHRGPCSVMIEGAKCWAMIAAEVGLPPPPAPAPDCAAGYLKARRELAVGYCKAQNRKDAACVTQEIKRRADDDQSPSVVAYEIEATLLPSGQTAHPKGGAVQCWPAD